MDFLRGFFGSASVAEANSQSLNEAAIEAKRASTVEPAYLILGATPGEDPNGRTFFDDPHYWLLSNESGQGDISRFFKIDFEKPEELAFLASELPGQFDVICFDFSVTKFFFNEIDAEANRSSLRSLHTLLKDNGLLILGYSDMTRSFRTGEPIGKETLNEHYRVKYNPLITLTGFKGVKAGSYRNLGDNEVIRQVYFPHTFLKNTDAAKIRLYIFSKKPSRGGKRSHRRKTRKNRK